MTIFDHSTHKAAAVSKLDIWRSGDGCGFHMRAANVVLTFTEEELEGFLRAAGGCYLGETCAHVEGPAEAAQTPHTVTSDEVASAASAEVLASVLEH